MRVFCLAITGIMFTAVNALGQTSSPALDLLSTSIRLTQVKNGDAKAALFVKASNFQALTKLTLDVRELPEERRPFFNFKLLNADIAPEGSVAETNAVWRVPFTVTGWTSLTSVKARLVVSLGEVRKDFEVTITDKPETAPTPKWQTPPTWHTVASSALPIAVGVEDGPVSGIRLVQASLDRAADPKLTLTKTHFELCGKAEGEKCEEVPPVEPGRLATVYLRPLKTIPPGEYAGKLIMGRNNDSSGNELQVKVYSTSRRQQLYGVGALVTGWLLFFLATVVGGYQRSKQTRIQAALFLVREIESLRERARIILKGAGSGVREAVNTKLDRLSANLDSDALKPFMPRLADPAARQSEFQTYMQRQGGLLTSCSIVIERGMPDIVRASNLAGGDRAKQERVLRSANDLLALVEDELARPTLLEKIKQEIDQLFTDLGQVGAQGLGAAGDVVVDLQRVELAINVWTWVSILAWLVLSMLSGALAMIATKPGFGSWVDLALCVLWGATVPVAGKALSDITATGAPSAFGISIPKIN